MKGYVCKVCKYISINGSAPDNCPVCGAPKTAFEEKDEAAKTAKDINSLNDSEKKHIPMVTIVKQCGLIPEGCVDAHVRIGQVQHPMQAEHYIIHIDFYINNEFAARTHLTPIGVNPAVGLHFKPVNGKLTVIELCNLHGAWANEASLA